MSGWEEGFPYFTIKNKDPPARPYPNLLCNSLFTDFMFVFLLFFFLFLFSGSVRRGSAQI